MATLTTITPFLRTFLVLEQKLNTQRTVEYTAHSVAAHEALAPAGESRRLVVELESKLAHAARARRAHRAGKYEALVDLVTT